MTTFCQRFSGTCRSIATKAVDKNGPTNRNESIFDLQMTIWRENSLTTRFFSSKRTADIQMTIWRENSLSTRFFSSKRTADIQMTNAHGKFPCDGRTTDEKKIKIDKKWNRTSKKKNEQKSGSPFTRFPT